MSLPWIIAIDFDGTLCENRWPEIGPPVPEAVDAARRARDNGAKLILWTCREGALLDDAVNWCRAQGLSFDAVNENLPEIIEAYGENCRKISATEYWDDRARTFPWLKHTTSTPVEQDKRVAKKIPHVEIRYWNGRRAKT